MKLITQEIQQRFAQVGDQSENPDPLVVAKLFDPAGSATWWLTEYDPQTNIARCYVTGLVMDEWGSVSITELEQIVRPFGLKIERDLYFTEKPISEHRPELKPQVQRLERLKEIENQHPSQGQKPKVDY